MSFKLRTALSLMIGAGMAGSALAQTDVPAGVHMASENWTLAGSPYRLKGQVYFQAGTTLTIAAGVVVASLPADQGSLAICRGADIFVNGTQTNPVIMTSTDDVATWTGTTGSGSAQIPGDPKTGVWREALNEWGNLTVMGDAYISENAVGGNTAVPSATNTANMEGLTDAVHRVYGGGNDDDDSGSITYLSLRYGGKVFGLNNELNGLSIGGLGRGTDIHHIDIMNNVDDGIECWGGTVNLKYVNIWNVGDDSFDIDQGWRGKAQFGLIVQGYSANAPQGSGVGDNCFETDGAEDSDWQPVTTATIYNFTVIGQPVDGDQGTAWRDNARVQYRNCIFMDLGEELVKFDNIDGDGAQGYGFNGTLSWADTWNTAYNAVPAHANDFTTGTYATNYAAQSSGRLAEITDSVFFRNQFATAYTEATARGVFAVAKNNVLIAGISDADSPVTSLTRGPAVVRGGKTMLPVISLDPRPQHEAKVSVAAAPSDGFFTPARYRGGFIGKGQSWLCNWTASTAFGYTSDCDTSFGFCYPNADGVRSCPCANQPVPNDGTRGCNNYGPNPVGGTGGAILAVTGASTANAGNSLVFHVTNMQTPATIVVLFAGTTQLYPGVQSGAGVRCVGGLQVPRPYKSISGFNASSIDFPSGNSNPNVDAWTRSNSPISGTTKYYYAAYRNPQAGSHAPCTPTNAFNLTNAMGITWTP